MRSGPPRRHPSARRPPVIRVVLEDGPVWVEADDRAFRSLNARHLDALARYTDYGDESKLREFDRHVIDVDGKPHRFLTDPAAIDRLGDAGELHFELYRR